MGRYAQRRRAGGGPSTAGSLISIDSARVDSTFVIVLSYTGDITAGDFTPADFQSQPSAAVAIALVQAGTNGMEATFAGDISSDGVLFYTGATPGILTPQTIALT